MLRLLLSILIIIILFISKFFLLLTPIKYLALKEKVNTVYSVKVNLFYKLYLISTVLFDLYFIIFYPTKYAGLILDILLIVVVFSIIQSKKKKDHPFRVLLPVYRKDSTENDFIRFMSDNPDASYILAANQTPLFITSTHKTEEEFHTFLNKLNHLDGLFQDLTTKKMRLLYHIYLILITMALLYIVLFGYIQSLVITL